MGGAGPSLALALSHSRESLAASLRLICSPIGALNSCATSSTVLVPRKDRRSATSYQGINFRTLLLSTQTKVPKTDLVLHRKKNNQRKDHNFRQPNPEKRDFKTYCIFWNDLYTLGFWDWPVVFRVVLSLPSLPAVTCRLDADGLAEHAVAVLVLAEHHELVLAPRLEAGYHGLRRPSVPDLDSPPLGGVRLPVPGGETKVVQALPSAASRQSPGHGSGQEH